MTQKVLVLLISLLGVLLCLPAGAWCAKKYGTPPDQGPSSVIAFSGVTGPSATAAGSPGSDASMASSITLTGQAAASPASSDSTGSTAGVTEPMTFDIVLLMDSSGSMKKTDPRYYRKDAARLFLSLVGPDDRVAVMSFGDRATMLIPPTLNTNSNRIDLFSAVDRISSTEFSTNILDGVRKGYEELRTTPNKNKFLIMMSDGRLALGSPEKDGEAHAALGKLLPDLKRANIKLYTVAFTEESDSALLETMARETGGAFLYAQNDRDVHLMFASIFEKLKTPDTIPFEGEAFVIDKDIREAIVLITKKPGTAVALRDPVGMQQTANRHAPSLEWYASSVFDMITVNEPVAGKWSVRLSTNVGNKVYVLTNLSLKCSFDKNFVTRGETIRIDAWLERQEVIVTEKSLIDNADFFAEVIGPDAKTNRIQLTSGKKEDVNGKYSLEVPAVSSGEYRVRITAEGKSFKREKNLQFRVVDAPVPSFDRRTAPMPVSSDKRIENDISWRMVLLRFALINLAAAALIAAYFIVRKILQKRPET